VLFRSTEIHRTYPASQTGVFVSHHVELRYQATVLATYDAVDALACRPYHGSLISYDEGITELDSGDLRPGSSDVDCTDGGFAGDSFGYPDCSCGSDQRCEPRITLDSPKFTRLSCAPIGPKLDGDACSFTADPAGAYDDCGSGLLCYEGTCHLLCSDIPPFRVLGPEYAYDVNICD